MAIGGGEKWRSNMRITLLFLKPTDDKIADKQSLVMTATDYKIFHSTKRESIKIYCHV
jgi:hypothetical protein